MSGRWVVLWVSLVLSLAVINTPQISVAWAQAQTETATQAGVFVDRAVVAYGENRFDEALKELQEALRLNPESVDALYYQGLVYAALNRAGDALAVWEKARGLNRADLDVAFQLGVLYFNQKEYEKAEPLLRQVYEPEPTRPNIGYYLGFIEYRKKNYREALTLLRGSVSSDDNFGQLTRFYAGLAMSALGFAREARVEIEEALRLQPVSPLTAPAQRFGEMLERAAQREKFFRGELRLGLFYDTNVPVIPNRSIDDTATTIREGNRRQRSEGQLASVNLAYKYLKTPDWEGDASYRFLQTYNDHLDNFNTQSHTPTIGINRRGTVASAFGDLSYVLGLQTTYDFITLGN
ncbi:MAG: tetratricopeptide repeat protein, partial [Deltaproteobacteria bacterium]|nr:tetratricopeptide repeat protein [Deltaproteobacteria bacterium]